MSTAFQDVEPIQLLIQFLGYSGLEIPKEEYALWLDELAVSLARAGRKGVESLLAFAPYADELQLRAILLALSCVKEELSEAQQASVCSLARSLLADRRPMVVAEAVDTLTSLGCPRARAPIAALLRRASPYVRGSALRYFARHHPELAVPLLEKALHSSDPIVRQNAVDELDELNYLPALAKIKRLLADPDKNVRQAARTAVEHLENAVP